jgi:hypothetical protein
MFGGMKDEAAERFREILVLRHDGEVYGEATFAGLAEGTSDAEQRYKWRVCETLERETKELLARELEQRGTRATESPERREQGAALGRRLAAVPWAMLMKGLRPELAKFVAEYEEAERSAPAAGAELARYITRHERALLEFVDRELAGRAAESVAPVVALLAKAPSPPA